MCISFEGSQAVPILLSGKKGDKEMISKDAKVTENAMFLHAADQRS
jgi:hypothetical protein